jgi:hypothetical protein
MANQHIILPYNTTSGAVPSAYSASTEGDNGIKAGELAVNLYQGQEFLVTRNENGDIIKFSSDNLALFEKGSGANSIQQKGTSCTASGDNSFAIGSGTTASGESSHAEGDSTTGGGKYSHAEGQGTFAQGIATHAEGLDTHANSNAAHAEGYQTEATGAYSHTEGRATSATTYEAHAEGSGTTASAEAAHAEGVSTIASGTAAHAEGTGTTASGNYSHAKGQSTIASGQSSHAEGRQTSALTEATHAEGSTTLANGKYSHAEGSGTYTEGQASHAEGINTSAMTNYSHAEGVKSLAAGLGSHAEGNYAIANNSNEHASGIYNKSHITGASEWDDLQGTTTSTGTVEPFTGTSTLFSVGFGSTGLRRNALEVTRQGQTLLNSRKTYFRYADASADIGDQSYAATGATQYQTTPGVAEYITMFDVIEKVRGNDNYAVFEKGSGANSAKQVGGNLQTISPNEVAFGKNNTSLSGGNNFTIFSVGNGEDDSITGRSNVFEIRQTNQPYGDNSTRIDKAIFKNCQISYTSSSHETKTISSTTGASSLSGITSGLGVSDGTKMIFINNSGATGNGVVYISSANTMVDGQKITLYFTNPQQIRTIDTNYDGITIYGHYNGNVETFLVGKASMAMNFKTSIIEIIKLGDNSFIVEFRNTTSAISGL